LGPALTQTAAQPGAARYTLRHASEAWLPREPRKFVVEPLIGESDVVMLVGAFGLGKTNLFLDMSVAVAVGQPWLGMATSSTPVLIVDEESGYRRLADRLERTMRGHGIPPGTELPLHFITMAGFSLLADVTWFVDLKQAIIETGARLVVIDALADVMLGGDENAVKDTQPIFRGLKGVAEETGAAFLVVHHTNKSGAYRGSTAIPAGVDLGLQMSRKDKGSPIKLETFKERDIEPMELYCRGSWDDTTQSFAFALEQPEPQEEEREQYGKGQRHVLAYLAKHRGGALKKDIEAAADICSAGTARNALYELAEKGYVTRMNTGTIGDDARYVLTGRGEQAAELLD